MAASFQIDCRVIKALNMDIDKFYNEYYAIGELVKETLYYDVDKISYVELIQKKKDFFNFIWDLWGAIDVKEQMV